MNVVPRDTGWPSGDPDAVVRDVLRDRAYRGGVTSAKPADDPWQPLRQWLQDHVGTPLSQWFDRLGHALWATRGVGAALGIAIDIAVAALVVFLIVRTVLALTWRTSAGGTLGQPLVDRAGAPADWRASAAAAAARGEYAAAIAALFRSALASLDRRAVVAFDGARTPGEYRRLVRRARPAISAPFDALAGGFVRATYAPGSPAREEYEAAERALSSLEPELAS